MENNLVWMDLEFSGLDPDTNVILEIATLVTDAQLNILAEGPQLAIHHPDRLLQGMDDWNKKHHKASGLLERVKTSRESHKTAQEKTLRFIAQYCKKSSAPLCGNSIHQDRKFLRKYMPGLDDYLHYRIVDVSTVKELARRWYPKLPPFKKKEKHLALDDIRESIEELKYYREKIFRSL
jgi:oligoribonuclease